MGLKLLVSKAIIDGDGERMVSSQMITQIV